MTVDESTVTNNEGSGIVVEGSLTLTNSTVSSDSIRLWNGSLTMTDSTIPGFVVAGSPFFPFVSQYWI